MNQDLKWLAENEPEWGGTGPFVLVYKLGLSARYCTKDTPIIVGFTRDQWQAARDDRLAPDIGVVESFLGNPFSSPEEDEEWEKIERRMDVIGQNGNGAEHYDAPPLELNKKFDTDRLAKLMLGLTGDEGKQEHHSSGSDNDYWIAQVNSPKRLEPYSAECEDLIELFQMTFQEGEAFKALWRKGQMRIGNGKPGDTLLRNSEKVYHFGGRMVAMEVGR